MSDPLNDTTSQQVPEYREHPWVPAEDRSSVDAEVLGAKVMVERLGTNKVKSTNYVIWVREHGAWETHHVTIDAPMREQTGIILRKRILEAVMNAPVGLRQRVPA